MKYTAERLKFQFHNGTINTLAGRGLDTNHKGFQFHNGTINTSTAE